ncbi:hypothetical protein [Roseovarius salis]|uniref:hypothetical protein n=1 Tax=Roseovarius salis TaxID=3376063 RepID=UPI0037C90702
MQIRRTPQQTIFVAVTALVAGALAAWNMRDGLRMDSTALLVLGGVFTAWAAYLLLDLARRGVPVRVGEDGLTIRHVVRDVHVPFAQMTWAKLDGGRRASILAYRPPGEKERYVAFAHRIVGAEGLERLRAAIAAARPDLPDRRPGTETDRGDA